jgi:hypothetical protein
LLLAPGYALANHFANRAARPDSAPPPGAWSSVCITLRTSERPAPYPQRLARLHPDAAPALQANPLWPDDTAQAASHVALYRFVADLIGIRHDVAEYGCASPAGTQLALQQFRKIALFDPRASVIADLQLRLQDNWRFEARTHNIISAPLSRPVDSVYCIDFIQYISPDEEEFFIHNLRASLARDTDFLVVGSPGAPLLQDAGCRSTKVPSNAAVEVAPAGRDAGVNRGLAPYPVTVYRRNGAELKELMARFFENVFVFSMVDDVGQPGHHPNARHVFALGCCKKAAAPLPGR